jgi:hypothetical protein
MNMHRTIKASEAYVSDMPDEEPARLQVPSGPRHQQQAAEEQLEIDEFYRQLNRALVPADISSIERQD